jgi:hypothetical protein
MPWIDAQLSSPFLKKEIKKFLREKTLIKNFFKYKKGVSHYHFGAKVHSEMIVYTFLLPGKNEMEEWRHFLAGPYINPTRSGIDINQNRQQININIRAAYLLNVMIMSEKSKKCLKIVVKIFG